MGNRKAGWQGKTATGAIGETIQEAGQEKGDPRRDTMGGIGNIGIEIETQEEEIAEILVIVVIITNTMSIETIVTTATITVTDTDKYCVHLYLNPRYHTLDLQVQRRQQVSYPSFPWPYLCYQ